MTVQKAHQELDTTPPASFTQQPLTPPHSDRKSRTVVEDVLREIKKRKDGLAVSRSPWLRHILSVSSYKELDDLIKTDDFVKEKLRYESNTLLRGDEHKSLTSTSDSTTSLRPTFLSFECHPPYTKQ
jgi:hypothetical protein